MTAGKSVFVASLLAATLTSVVMANAHAALVKSDPPANETVVAPQTINLTFSEKLTSAFSGFDLSMDDGMKMAVANTISADGMTMVGTPKGKLMSGNYKISWHAVAADGHRSEGSLPFKVK
jgi:methionine-rich copper-binding protein CopC